MSDIKLSANLFLETQELNRLIKFLSTDGYKRVFQSMLNSYGIVLPSNNSDGLKVGTGSTGNITVNPGVAFNSDLDGIILQSSRTISAPNTGTPWWVKISRVISNWEAGTVSIQQDGSLVGTGTTFTEVLRGQPNYPVKVRLNSASANAGDYEVVNVSSNTEAVLAGSFSVESGLRYAVVGAFSPGFQASEANRLIYEYDDINIELVSAATQPTLIDGMEFLLAKVSYNSVGEMVIEDLRSEFAFNSPYASGGSRPTNNQLASLVSWMPRNGQTAFQMDFGYKIDTFSVEVGTVTNVITITSGSSHYLGNAVPPNDIFKGWKIVNTANMRSCFVDSNTGRDLYSASFSNSLLDGTNDALIVVPNWYDMEFRFIVTPPGEDPVTIYHRVACDDRTGLFFLPYTPLMEPGHEATINYRMIAGELTTPWQTLALVQFTNGVGTDFMISSDSTVTF